jgi:hypothetical protein
MPEEKSQCVDLAANCEKSTAAARGEDLRHQDAVGFPNVAVFDFIPHGLNRCPGHHQYLDWVCQILSVSPCSLHYEYWVNHQVMG